MKPFIAVMIVPTGIGAKIGGHSGDATIYAKLLAGVCDTLILHPNVVNAADLNEMPSNSLYVEGSMLDRFLSGSISLKEIRANKILLVYNLDHPETINCALAAQSLLGVEIETMKLTTHLRMISEIHDGVASGKVTGWQDLVYQVKGKRFDALAIHSVVEVDPAVELSYMEGRSHVNPWGGVEAKLSRSLSQSLMKPVAHAPVDTTPNFNQKVFQALSPEMISGSMLFSVLKGLHKAPLPIPMNDSTPNILSGISANDVDALVSPMCWGDPHKYCLDRNIPIILVEENTTNSPSVLVKEPPGAVVIRVSSYMSAVGALMALREGISVDQLHGR